MNNKIVNLFPQKKNNVALEVNQPVESVAPSATEETNGLDTSNLDEQDFKDFKINGAILALGGILGNHTLTTETKAILTKLQQFLLVPYEEPQPEERA